MKKEKTILLTLLFTLASVVPSFGQNPPKGYVMNYIIEGKDTIYIDEIPPAKIHPRQTMNKRDWVKYYKRVYNFSKAYPYALFISETINKTEKLFITKNYTKKQKEKYLKNLKKDLLDNFDPIFRNISLKQGLMIIRLIDREVGKTPYYIIKDYLGGVNASFWQGVAKLFKGDLKRPYDRLGEDKDLEELVEYWKNGEFRDLYYSIFFKEPPEIVLPEKFK